LRDLLEFLRASLAGRRELMRLIRAAAVSGGALDLSSFTGDSGNVQFVLLGSVKGSAIQWRDII
jgi:hypothetical protein